MGVCTSNDFGGLYNTPEEQDYYKNETKRSKDIGKVIKRDKSATARDLTMLLLGPGDSGKSTILKQMVHLYGGGYSDDQRMYYKFVVMDNVIECAQNLIKYSREFGEEQEFQGKQCDCSIHDEAVKRSAEELMELKKNQETVITPKIAANLRAIWEDEGIKNTRHFGHKFNMLDNADHFFSQLDVLSKPQYIPSYKDVIRTRNRTSGIVETNFMYKKYKFKIFDVGGQRNERRKWVHCFEGVKAVIFIAAISEYDQMLFEDPTVHRIDEAVALFDELSHSRWFTKTAMILFLNKHDLFLEKLKYQPLSVYPSYDGPEDPSPEEALTFFQDKFVDAASDVRDVYVHVTCATDTEGVATVFESVKDLSIRLSITEWGLQ